MVEGAVFQLCHVLLGTISAQLNQKSRESNCLQWIPRQESRWGLSENKTETRRLNSYPDFA